MRQELLNRRDQLTSYLPNDPENPTLLCDLAVINYQLGDRASAQSLAESALAKAPQQAPAHAVLGLLAFATNQVELAVKHLSQAIELGDNTPLLHYQLAHALIKQGEHERAEIHALYAAQHGGDDLPLASALYIRTLHYLGKMEEAIAFGNKTAEDPSKATSALLSTLASVYMDAEDLESAERLAKLALEQDPNDADSRMVLGMLALTEADEEQALSTFQNLTENHPENGRAWLGLGLSKMLGNSLEAAAEPLQNAARAMQNHTGTLIALAWIHILSKNAQAAEKALSTAMEVDRNFAEVHGSLAVVALMKGNLDGAVQASKRAHGLDPDNFTGQYASSLIQQLSGNREQAAAIMEKLLSASVMPNGESLHSTIAQALAKRV